MAANKLEWHGDQILARIGAEISRRIQTCCILVYNRAKELLNTEGAGIRAAAGVRRDKKGRSRKKKGGLVYGANPSAPGEAPHKQRGRLLASVAWEVDGQAGRVGTNLLYGRWLELGTRLMAARPWLRRALRERRDAILRILAAPMKGP